MLKKRYFFMYFGKLTFLKILNAFSVYTSYLFSIIFKFPKRWGYPVGISVEPTATCNLHCPECPSGTGQLSRFKGNMNFPLFKTIIDEFAPYLLNLILYFQGEPFLNKEIFQFIEYASLNKRIFTISSTNGHFLSNDAAEKTVRSGLDKLIVSLDGACQETYEKYRKGGDFNSVISGIKNLVFQKERLNSQTPLITVQFLVFKFNEHEIEDIKKLCKELKVDKLEFKSAQIYDLENHSDSITSIEKYSRYKKNKDGKFIIKSKLKNRCKRLWESSVITNEGEVLPCCFDKNAEYSGGNINTFKFSEINNSSSSISFRKRLLQNRKQTDICRNCTEGLK